MWVRVQGVDALERVSLLKLKIEGMCNFGSKWLNKKQRLYLITCHHLQCQER